MGNCYDRTKPGFLLFIDQFSQRPYKEETLHSAETLEQKNHKQVKMKNRDKYRDKTKNFSFFLEKNSQQLFKEKKMYLVETLK